MRIARNVFSHGGGAIKEVKSTLNLESKMNAYNRQKMITGLDNKHGTHKEVMRTLGALD